MQSGGADRLFLVWLTSGRTDLSCRSRIGRPQAVGCAGRRRESPETRSRGGGSTDLANPAPQGSIRPGFGSGVAYERCVAHLESLRASGWSAAARATTVAALRGGVRRRACVRAVLTSALGANGSACVCEEFARETRASAGLCGARHGEFAVRRRRCTGVPALWFLECATGPKN